MAVSPLVFPTQSPSSASKSKLANAARAPAGSATKDERADSETAGRDLAEQMNEDEKHKWVKGTSCYL